MKGKKHSKSDEAGLCMLLFIIGIAAFLMTGVIGDGGNSNGMGGSGKKGSSFSIKRSSIKVIDGDTLEVKKKGKTHTIRLLQVNSPELSTCYGRAAKRDLDRLMEGAKKVTIKYDTKLDPNRFDRLLVYVYVDKQNLNLRLVKRGSAETYFIDDERGDYANKLESAQASARKSPRGLWKACN